MAVDIKYLKSQGVSAAAYKKLFTAPPRTYPKRVQELVQLISKRARDAKYRNFQDWRMYAAIDYAYEIPFRQTTATLVNHILSNNLSREETINAVKAWGLPDSLVVSRPKGNGEEGTEEFFDAPTFYQIFVPLCVAYTTIRLAKLFNERNQEILLQYKPLKETNRNRVLCEIVEDLVNTISNWYGYPAILRQAIRQTLKYGLCLAFPREEWHHEQQCRLGANGKEETYTVKEGIRPVLLHPTRSYIDPNFPPSSINSDTGCEYFGGWYVRRYGDILDDRKYWNRERIFVGTNWLDVKISGNYFTEFFPCKMVFPQIAEGLTLREDRAAYYNSGARDQALFLTEHFQKIVPGDWGLGEYEDKDLKKLKKGTKPYKNPVWHRFTLAGDSTIVYASPCAYTPGWFMGYDFDDAAAKHSSLGLEIIPWQDELGNLLSQMIRVAKQNLVNVNFYDKNIINETDIRRFESAGSAKYEGMNFIGYDSLLLQKSGLNIGQAFYPMQLNKQQMTELLQLIPTMLNVMERVLQISAQEAGSAASHQQSKEEVVQTAGTSQNRVIFTGAGIDEGVDAWKRQIFEGAVAYMDPTISAEISADIKDLKANLEQLGFEITDTGDKTVMVRGSKTALRLEGFAATNRGPEPGREKEMAQVIFQTLGAVANQPEVLKQVGISNIISLLEQAAKFAGAPRDFTLQAKTPGSDAEIPPMIMQAIQQAQQAAMQAIEEKVAKPAAQAVAQDQAEIAEMKKTIDSMKGIVQAFEAQVSKQVMDEKKIQIRAQESAADIQMKQQRTDADIALKTKKTDADIRIAEAKAQSSVAIQGATAAHSAHLSQKAQDAKQESGDAT